MVLVSNQWHEICGFRFFFGFFSIWGRHITLSFSILSGLVPLFSFLIHICSPFVFIYFLLHIFSYNISPPQFWSSYPIFQCPLTSIFHVLITTSSCVFPFTCPNPISLTSLIVSLIYATPVLALISSFLIFSIVFIPNIHLNILISVLSSKPLSVFPSAQV